MNFNKLYRSLLTATLLCVAAAAVNAQSFRVQCPTSTITHPGSNNAEPAYAGPTTFTTAHGYQVPNSHVNGAIKCQQISGGDGYATMGDGTQTYMFSFGPLSGLLDLAKGLPGTQFPSVFNTLYAGTLQPGDPATTGLGSFLDTNGMPYNGAVGLVNDADYQADNPSACPAGSFCNTGHVACQ